MKNILLINPPVSIYLNKTAFAPLPLLVLGTCLKKIRHEGHVFSHELLDLDLRCKQGALPDDASFYDLAVDLVMEKNPDILFFTVHGPNHIIVLNLAERIKKRRKCLVIVGGVGPTLQAKEAMEKCAQIDIIVKGEGEPVLEHLVPAVLNGGDFAKVPSIVYREDGKVYETPRGYLDPKQPIPRPDYSLLRLAEYLHHNQTNPYIHPGFVLIESGRGCHYGCSFCAPAKMWERKVRYRPIAEIIDEMKFLAAQGGNFSFFTQDNLDKHFLGELSEALLKENNKISWGCYSRLDQLPEENAQLLADAGCSIIFTGLETTDADTQKKINKVINTENVFDKLKAYNAYGIRFIGSFIGGFPDESETELESTMLFALECAAGCRFADLSRHLERTRPEDLPQKAENICVIHPLHYMPGTDSFESNRDSIRLSEHSFHPDCHGSYLFGYDQYKDDWSLLGTNPYLNHLPEEKVRYYCTMLRLFNFMNSRPYFFALLMNTLGMRPLKLLKSMVAHLGEKFVLSSTVPVFEAKVREYAGEHLEFVPQWTVKKGQ